MEKEKDREKNKKKRGFSTSILGGGVVENFSVKVQTVDILSTLWAKEFVITTLLS